MSGDGIVFQADASDQAAIDALTPEELAAWDGLSDLGWVLTLRLDALWTLPQSDERTGAPSGTGVLGGGKMAGAKLIKPKAQWPDFWKKAPRLLDLGEALSASRNAPKAGRRKALPLGGNEGDDIFIVVRTSETISAHEAFRMVVPARLPGRKPDSEALAGLRFSPRAYPVSNAFQKSSPEEGPTDFYGHDMLESEIPTRLVDLTINFISGDLNTPNPFEPQIVPGGLPLALMGIDVSVNRPENIFARGNLGISSIDSGIFTAIDGGPWTDEVVGLWLIAEAKEPGQAERIEAYEITGFAARNLQLKAGVPAANTRGTIPWIIVKDPTFLEQVVVELYDTGLDGNFDPGRDLLPLGVEDPLNPLLDGAGNVLDPRVSGLSLYRDNDFHPANTNGVFDLPIVNAQGELEYVDLPVALDGPPRFIGVANEPEFQVRFSFASPGTDDFKGRESIMYEDQARLRQWVPHTYGRAASEPDFGPDFFVVARTSRQMRAGDDFSVAIVSWGPNTPTEPEPDNFAADLGGTSGQGTDEFDIFSEFPWGSRGLGFITFFKDPPELRSWTFNKDRLRQEPYTELDTSMDDIVAARGIPYWVRTNPQRSGRTRNITALPAPPIDFVADRTRQLTDTNIGFTLLAPNTQVASVLWDFGDGETSDVLGPSHEYAAEGLYTVSVTVTDINGVTVVVAKQDYIEIEGIPLADFFAQPLVAPVGATISFFDLSIGTGNFAPTGWTWDFGDARPGPESVLQNPQHVYFREGFYTVSLETTFTDAQTGATLVAEPEQKIEYIIILPGAGPGLPGAGGEGEGEGEDISAADFDVETLIRDREGLVPLHDWVPLFNFTMSFGDDPDDFAPRVLQTLTYVVHPDDDDSDDLNYSNAGAPDLTDILEFGLFEESFDTGDDDNNNELDFIFDTLRFTWDSSGFPVGTAVDSGVSIRYTLDFIGNGTPAAPQFPVFAGPDIDNSFPGRSYIVAMRTSATWRSQLTTAVDVTGARMIIPIEGVLDPVTLFPIDDDGDPVDSYSPDFFDGDILEPDEAYSSSFGVFDITGTLVAAIDGADQATLYNSWNHPSYPHFSTAEFTRPAWNAPARLLDAIAGENLALRKLMPVEAFVPAIGINMHSTLGIHFDQFDPISFGERFPFFENFTTVQEVNIVLSDIGADPLGPPGNGGLNAPTGLDSMQLGARGNTNFAIGSFDLAFNGISLWGDTNGNGIFDPPTQNPGGGINLDGDLPMEPFTTDEWEYLPFPPGGGDPWWRISLRLFGWDRTFNTDPDNVPGALETQPDNHYSDGTGSFAASNTSYDYFVVVRADSGLQDISLDTGDGVGINQGADFRVFIEPRRFNGVTGLFEGGIYIDSMLPPLGWTVFGNDEVTTWQNDPRWGEVEPWWPQRTMNQSVAKPMRVGLEVHDLTLLYDSDSDFATVSDIFLGESPFSLDGCFGFAVGFNDPTDFDRWVDPFGLTRSQFLHLNSVGVINWGIFEIRGFNFGAGGFTLNFEESFGHISFETAPFFNTTANENDIPPETRSGAYPNPPQQPQMPSFFTWPAEILPGEFPRLTHWAPENAQARQLNQKIDVNSNHTPMLGINLAGTDDLNINGRNETTLAKITVAFWGPDFTPDDLAPLDPNGRDQDAGVLLWEDTDQDSVFSNTEDFAAYPSTPVQFTSFDSTIPLRGLQWRNAAEPIDLDGDGVADDMNGDGIVDEKDNAWILELVPEDLWVVPHTDVDDTPSTFGIFNYLSCLIISFKTLDDSSAAAAAAATAYIKGRQDRRASGGQKALDPLVGQPGDDLFITVKTSDRLGRFEKFRAVIPAKLPARQDNQNLAGIQLFPQVQSAPSAFVKSSPDEDPVQDFYSHDMLEANVPVKILDLANQTQRITAGGAALPVMGLDISTNRPDGTRDSGADGVGLNDAFAAPAAAWEVNAFVGDWLIDENFEPFEITANTATQLALRSGKPADGDWRIVQEPTFLEQVIVEFYNEGLDADFNPIVDLLPLDLDQRLSGVALYRDNDNHPANSNGIFDPEIDIPVALDAPPRFVGIASEDIQVKFVFSTPGTDDVPKPLEEQARNREWVYDTFGNRASDPASGADFFIVVRASQDMDENNNFRMGIVNWGPNTPTEPDPDTWAGLEGEARNDFTKFQEFPWGSRAIAFITMFKEPPMNYYLEGNIAKQRPDSSDFNWIRSHSTQKRRSGVITARARIVGPNAVVVQSVSETNLPAQIDPDVGFALVIRGQGFGRRPVVALSGYNLEVTSVNREGTVIDVTLTSIPGEPPGEPLVLIVRNPDTKEEESRNDLFSLVPPKVEDAPVIERVAPERATRDRFPVRIFGAGFAAQEELDVIFGSTHMPVINVSEDGAEILIGFPAGGMARVGRMDVTVRNLDKSTEDVLLDGFFFVNPAKGGFGCAAKEGAAPRGGFAGDLAILMLTLLALGAFTRVRRGRP